MHVSLKFGTAGIRARMGEGDHELNVRTVRAVIDAALGYLREIDDDAITRGICVGFDGRKNSRSFADEVVSVALARGFLVRAFDAEAPTPLVAFCTQYHEAAAGFVVTASHNPPADNGIKLYWHGGRQISAPHDANIAARIAAITEAPEVEASAVDGARQRGLLLRLGEREEQAYLARVLKLAACRPELALPRIAYTATAGVGSPITHALLECAGVSTVVEVEEQRHPLPDFGGLASPNPEHPEALRALVALAESAQAQLAFAHDPDADRLAVLARDEAGLLRSLTGDEVGALLGDFALTSYRGAKPALLVSTLVSGGLLEAIARARGAHFERTYTGFKWIAARARSLESERGFAFVFGYEEAIGYAFGALGDDKDGIAALYVILCLARELHARGETLTSRLEALSREHGLFASRQLVVSAPDDRSRISAIMSTLRTTPTTTFMPEGSTRTDYLAHAVAEDLLVFQHPSGLRVCVRPSGTEPKLKLYLHVRREVASDQSMSLARDGAERALDELAERLRTLIG